MWTIPYLRAHFHGIGVAIILTLVGLTLIPHILYYDPIETAVEKKGHLKDIYFEKGKDTPSNRYVIRFNEYPGGFEITGLSDGDQYLLTQAERIENLFVFSVTALNWKKALNGETVALTALKSDQNVYRSDLDLGNWMQKTRYFAFLMTALSAVLAFFQWRKTGRHAAQFLADNAAKTTNADSEEDSRSAARSQTPEEGEDTPAPLIDYDIWWITLAQTPALFFGGLGTLLGYIVSMAIPGGGGTWLGFWITTSLIILGMLAQLGIRGWQKIPVFAQIVDNHHRKLAAGPPRPTTSKPKHLKAIEMLLKHKGNVNAQNDKGQTAMHIAAQVGATEAVALLIQNGGKVNLTDGDGNTPLHIAVAQNRNGVVHQLIKSGADVLIANMDGLTPLGVLNAAKAKNNSLLETLTHAEALAKVAAEKAKEKAKEKAAADAAAAGISEAQAGAEVASTPAAGESDDGSDGPPEENS